MSNPVQHRPTQFNTSVPHKNHTFSAPTIPQFNTKNPSVQHRNSSVPHLKPLSSTLPSVSHRKPLSSTPKPPQFHIKNPSVLHQKPLWTTHPSVQHQKPVSSTHPLVLNWGVFGVELRDFGGWKGVALLCGIDVLNWGGCETEGDPSLIYAPFKY